MDLKVRVLDDKKIKNKIEQKKKIERGKKLAKFLKFEQKSVKKWFFGEKVDFWAKKVRKSDFGWKSDFGADWISFAPLLGGTSPFSRQFRMLKRRYALSFWIFNCDLSWAT